jgi:hypothetical protein
MMSWDREASNRLFDLNGEAKTARMKQNSSNMTDYAKRSYENSTKAMEKLFGVKSLDKVIEVQSEYAKAVYEDYTTQATKLGKLYTDLAKEAFKPYEGLAAKTSSAK